MSLKWIAVTSFMIFGALSHADTLEDRYQLAKQRAQVNKLQKNRADLQKRDARFLTMLRSFAQAHSGLAEEPRCANRLQKDASPWAIDPTVDRQVCAGGICAIVHGEFNDTDPDSFEQSIYSCSLTLKNDLKCGVAFEGLDWEKFGGACFDARGNEKDLYVSTKSRNR